MALASSSQAAMHAEAATVQVLLATYNGAAFLREQIDSILGQTYPAVAILARDDGSADGTQAILEEYARRFPARFRVLRDGGSAGGAKWNFVRLLGASSAPYVALADQDDVWLPDKLALSMDAIRNLQRKYGTAEPLLVFTDLHVVDRDLRPIHASFWRHQHIDPRRIDSLSHLLAQNTVTGCTAVMNRALVERSLAMPDAAFMHDWWIALTASALGQARGLAQATVLYRQHGSNAVGAVLDNKRRLIPRPRYHEKRRAQWEVSARQAAAFLAANIRELPKEKRRVLEAYARCEASPNRVTRVLTYLRYRLFLKGLRPNLAMLWYLWDMKAAKRNDVVSAGDVKA